MRILFDATPLALRSYTQGGAYRYGVEVLRELPAALPADWQLRLYFNFFRGEHVARMEEAVRLVGAEDPICTRWHPKLLRALRIPAEWTGGRHDVFHGAFDRVPPSRGSARVVTIQDLAFLRSPEGLPEAWVNELARTVPPSARRAHAVLTGSEFSRLDIIERLGVAPERVHVVPHGVSGEYRPSDDVEADARRLRERYGIEPGFVLFLGTLQPNKNVEGLCAAWSLLRARGVGRQLVLAGSEGWLFDEMWARIVARGDDAGVVRTGFVDDEDVPRLYANCAAFTLVSRLEGFGIPVLEAMACDAPVVAADACSLPEVAGGAALLVDPNDPESIAEGIERALEPDTAAQLREAGRMHARDFTWSRAARGHVETYRAAAREKEAHG